MGKLLKKVKPTSAEYFKSESQRKKSSRLAFIYGSKQLVAVISVLVIASVVSGIAIVQKQKDSKAFSVSPYPISSQKANWQTDWAYRDSGSIEKSSSLAADKNLVISFPIGKYAGGQNACYKFNNNGIAAGDTLSSIAVTISGNMAGSTTAFLMVNGNKIADPDGADTVANRAQDYTFTVTDPGILANVPPSIEVCHQAEANAIAAERYIYVKGFVIRGQGNPATTPAPAATPTPTPTPATTTTPTTQQNSTNVLIKGFVKGPNDEGIKGAKIGNCIETGTGGKPAAASTDANGYYQFSIKSGTSYCIRVVTDETSSKILSGNASYKAPITAVSGSNGEYPAKKAEIGDKDKSFNFIATKVSPAQTAASTNVKIKGFVKGQSGEPVENAQINNCIETGLNNRPAAAKSDKNGYYEFSLAANTAYCVRINTVISTDLLVNNSGYKAPITAVGGNGTEFSARKANKAADEAKSFDFTVTKVDAPKASEPTPGAQGNTGNAGNASQAQGLTCKNVRSDNIPSLVKRVDATELTLSANSNLAPKLISNETNADSCTAAVLFVNKNQASYTFTVPEKAKYNVILRSSSNNGQKAQANVQVSIAPTSQTSSATKPEPLEFGSTFTSTAYYRTDLPQLEAGNTIKVDISLANDNGKRDANDINLWIDYLELRKAPPEGGTTAVGNGSEGTTQLGQCRATTPGTPALTQVDGKDQLLIEAENMTSTGTPICVIDDTAKSASGPEKQSTVLFNGKGKLSYTFNVPSNGQYTVDAIMRSHLVKVSAPATYKLEVTGAAKGTLTGEAGLMKGGEITEAETFARRSLTLENDGNKALYLNQNDKVTVTITLTNDTSNTATGADRNLAVDFLRLRKIADKPAAGTTNNNGGSAQGQTSSKCSSPYEGLSAPANALFSSNSTVKTESVLGLEGRKYLELANDKEYVQCQFKLPENAEPGKYVLRTTIRPGLNGIGTEEDGKSQKIELSMAGGSAGVKFEQKDVILKRGERYKDYQMSLANDNPRQMNPGDQVVARVTKISESDPKLYLNVEKIELVRVVDASGNVTPDALGETITVDPECSSDASTIAPGHIRVEAENTSNRDTRKDNTVASRCKTVAVTKKNNVVSVKFTIPRTTPPNVPTKYSAVVSAKVTGKAESRVTFNGKDAVSKFDGTLKPVSYGAPTALKEGDTVTVSVKKTNGDGELEVDYIELVPDGAARIETPEGNDNSGNPAVTTGFAAPASQNRSVVNDACAAQKSIETTTRTTGSARPCTIVSSGDNRVVKLSKDFEYVEHTFAPAKERGNYIVGFTMKSTGPAGGDRAHQVAKLYVNGQAVKISGQGENDETFNVKADQFRLYSVRLAISKGETITLRVVFDNPGNASRTLLVENAQMIRVAELSEAQLNPVINEDTITAEPNTRPTPASNPVVSVVKTSVGGTVKAVKLVASVPGQIYNAVIDLFDGKKSTNLVASTKVQCTEDGPSDNSCKKYYEDDSYFCKATVSYKEITRRTYEVLQKKYDCTKMIPKAVTSSATSTGSGGNAGGQVGTGGTTAPVSNPAVTTPGACPAGTEKSGSGCKKISDPTPVTARPIEPIFVKVPCYTVYKQKSSGGPRQISSSTCYSSYSSCDDVGTTTPDTYNDGTYNWVTWRTNYSCTTKV